MVDFSQDDTTNKLLLLFVFDKMDVALQEGTIIDICNMQNDWMSYMECIQAVNQLTDAGFIYQSTHDKSKYYLITPAGRMCLGQFYTRIPSSIREDIAEFVKKNRMEYKRRQEYFKTYKKNEDGTYTVWLKIINPVSTALELKLTVPTRTTAKQVCSKWEEKAASLYYLLHEQLIDNQ